jgi:hypothetical protein
MSTIYSRSSPYYNTSVVNGHLDIIDFRDIPSATDDVLYIIPQTYSLRPDLLAYDIYGDQNLWWVFSVRNKNVIQDPVYDLVAGQRIYLPSISNLTNLGII